MTLPPYYQPSHTGRNIVIAIIIVVVVVVAALAVTASVFFFTAVNRSSLTSLRSQNIVTGPIIVPAGHYRNYEFTVPTTARSIYLTGGFTVTSSTGNYIIVYILDHTNFVNWSNNNPYTAIYNSGQMTSSGFYVSLKPSTTYDLVYSNKLATSTDKTVQTSASLIYSM